MQRLIEKGSEREREREQLTTNREKLLTHDDLAPGERDSAKRLPSRRSDSCKLCVNRPSEVDYCSDPGKYTGNQ